MKKICEYYAAEEYVDFKTAVLLYRAGFKGDANFGYNSESKDYLTQSIDGFEIPAPTQAVAMRWIAGAYGIFISLAIHKNGNGWFYRISTTESLHTNKPFIAVQKTKYLKYENTCDLAIQYCLKYLILKDEN